MTRYSTMEKVTAGMAILKVEQETISFVPGSKTVINENDVEVIDAAIKCIHSSTLWAISLDLEGVDLCRVGPACIIPLA